MKLFMQEKSLSGLFNSQLMSILRHNRWWLIAKRHWFPVLAQPKPNANPNRTEYIETEYVEHKCSLSPNTEHCGSPDYLISPTSFLKESQVYHNKKPSMLSHLRAVVSKVSNFGDSEVGQPKLSKHRLQLRQNQSVWTLKLQNSAQIFMSGFHVTL